MPAKDYRDLVVWKKAFELTLAIYRETAHFPAEEKYGLTSQLRRCSVSIPSNIAEGEGRGSREFRHYLSMALGSLNELETQILLCRALKYMADGQVAALMALAGEVGRLTNGLSRSLRG